MIDTDKYEGHTEGEWMLDYRDWNWAINIFGKDGETIEANAILIQDAPLLLEEVKRLREELRILNGMNNALWDTVENYDICLDDFTMIDLLSPPDGYEYCEDELRWVKKE